MEKPTKTATYITHDITVNDKKVKVLKLTFMFPDGSGVAEVSIQSEKYIEYLAKTEEFKGVQTLEDIAENIKARGQVELFFNQSSKFIGYSLTDSAYISTKTNVVKTYGEQIEIVEVEADDMACALHFADGTISKRNFSTEVMIDGEKRYFPALDKKLRFLQSLGITGDLATYDMQDLVGGRCDYIKQDSTFGAWFKHENFTPKQNFSRDVNEMSVEEQLAMMGNQ